MRAAALAIIPMLLSGSVSASGLFDSRELTATVTIGATITLSSAVYAIHTARCYVRRERPSPTWAIGGLSSGISSALVGAAELFLGLFSLQFDEGTGTSADQYALISVGAVSFLAGAIATLFTSGAMRMPAVDRPPPDHEPIDLDDWGAPR